MLFMQLSLPLFSDDSPPGGSSPGNTPLQVTQLFERLNVLLNQTAWTSRVCVVGEVSSPKLCYGKHFFFTLKDQQSAVHCKIFFYNSRRCGAPPQAGERLTVYGSISTYGPGGEIYLKTDRFSRSGQGELLLRLEKLKARLRSEHLFDDERKRPLPSFPRVIGLVTSENGMAFGDIQKIFRERAPHVRLWLIPALVQGANAPQSMIAALRRLERLQEVDAVILGRGGGSREDLMAFNDEALVRTVAAYSKPIVTAIGHDGDHSLCDLAADKVASTPTNAAEVITPSRNLLLAEINQQYSRAQRQLRHLLELQRRNLLVLRQRCQAGSPQHRIDQDALLLNTLHTRLQQASQLITQKRRHQLEAALNAPGWSAFGARLARYRQETADLYGRAEAAFLDIFSRCQITVNQFRLQLQALDPHQALQRGYAMISDRQGRVISSVQQLTPGQELTLELSDGQAAVNVSQINHYGNL